MRLAWWCIAFVAGDACALADAIGWRAGVVFALIAAAAIAGARRRRAAAGVLLAFFALGALLGTRAMRPPPPDPALAATCEREDAQQIEGTIARGPESTGTGARLIVTLARIAGAPASGTVALAVLGGWPDFGPGERIAFRARLHEVHGTRNPGLPDPALAFRAAGIDALAGVPDAGGVTRLAEPTGVGPRRIAFLVRRGLRAAIDREARGDAAAFLKTAVLGDRRGIGPDVEDGFRIAGATHVLSVSGLHLAAVAALLFFVVRSAAARVPRLPLYVDPRAVAAAVALPAIAMFALVTGEAIATLRSALMLSIGMGAYLVGRRASAGPAIAAATLVLLAGSPLELADPSLQLSVASVVGIALGARGIGPGAKAAAQAGRARRALAWLWRFVAATIAATAATAPLVAHHFGEVAPLSPLGNLALVPIVELAVVPVGLAGAIAGAVWTPAGKLPLAVAGFAAKVALAIAGVFHAHGLLWLCRTPNGLETAALTGAGCLALIAAGRAGTARRVLACAALAAAVVAFGSLAIRDIGRRRARDLTVTFLDIGQGDAAVIEAPGPAVMLIDGGGVRDGSFDTGARIVEPFLRARGIGRLDVIALSHPHPDHLNGLFRIVERFDVGAFWSSGDDGHNPEYGRFVGLARQRGVPMPEVGPARLGDATVVPLGPFESDPGGAERIHAPAGLSVNDASLVLSVAFAGRRVLFPGDLEADGEGELVGRRDTGQVVAADVLKVPHHGSRTSSTPELVDAVAPDLAVISLGWRNQFHFPAAEVVARYAPGGTRVLRTDRDGAISLTISPDGRLTVRCERGCPADSTQPDSKAVR